MPWLPKRCSAAGAATSSLRGAHATNPFGDGHLWQDQIVSPSETTAPPAWSWDEYEDWLTPQWQHCVEANAHDELAVHHFLEEHPCLLPGGEADSGSIGGHHGPWPAVVVSQPPLNGTFLRRPDFLWPTKVSSVFMPVFLELERPDKKWFTSSGQQTAELSQAVAQVAEWRTWLESAANQLGFHEMYGVSSAIRSYFRFQPVFHLVYGRRAEFIQDNRKSQTCDSLRPEWLSWSTYDRLTPSANACALGDRACPARGRLEGCCHSPYLRLSELLRRRSPARHRWIRHRHRCKRPHL